MIVIGQYGWKIRNYKAATIYGKNTGIRERYDYTEAMLHHSLFTRWLENNGMVTDAKNESTKDIICIDFQFGLRSYKEEVAHLKKMRKDANDAGDDERIELIGQLEEKVESKKNLYKKISKDQIRREFYINGVPITYEYKDKKTGEIVSETINYKMLYRNPSKAKRGSCMFIREELYDSAYRWLTMGIGERLPYHNAKIVEISAYAPLTTSSIEGTVNISTEDILILEDKDSFFRTIADIVRATDYEVTLSNGKKETRRKCTVHREEIDVKNTIWDGMALIESSTLPKWCNGMGLLRQHFFKACAFKTYIQKFFRNYCEENHIDYDTYEITDMFGVKHLAKNIKLITTDNAIKWKKFKELMGDTLLSAYEYWCEHVNEDGCVWGIVKTDHVSKLGDQQQMSYQMINTLPCSYDDIQKISQTSVDYVELLKSNNDEFEKFLRKNATAVNHYEMLADLYNWNHYFANSKMWKVDKSKIISQYVNKLRRGKITVSGDNLTVCGNPYALLLYAVGANWEEDPTFYIEDGLIQCYTKRFDDGEYLCAIRNPHNSSNNLGYFKNVKHYLMEEYFDFSPNIMAVNCIHTDIQSRMNGMDFDSDFCFTTNQPQMVEAARIAYRDFPTVVNEVGESGLSYNNDMSDYAKMDSMMQQAQKAIGGASDTAQLCQSYYWDKVFKNELDDDCEQYYENAIILAVCAQLAIDGCKRLYEVDVTNDISRIRSQDCMAKSKDFPLFMKWTHEIPVTKNGKERSVEEIKKDKSKLKRRIDKTIVCPMNWLQDCLDKIQGSEKNNFINTRDFYIKIPGKADNRQMSKIRSIVEDYDGYTKRIMSLIKDYADSDEADDLISLLCERTETVLEQLNGLTISKYTMNRLIGSVMGVDWGVQNINKYKITSKYIHKLLNLLYRTNKQLFLNCFITGEPKNTQESKKLISKPKKNSILKNKGKSVI